MTKKTSTPRRAATIVAALALLGVTLGSVATTAPSATAASFAPGFSATQAFSGLTLPVALRFAPTGQVFVAEKDGIVKSFSGLEDTSATVFADLRANVLSYVDRGLLGLEVDPQFPTRPYVYVLYTYDHVLGDPAPPPKWRDDCPGTIGDPVGNGSCRASARLSRLTAQGPNFDVMRPGSERVLVEDWCQQFPVHTNGTVAFGSDGALYAGHGEAGSPFFTDYGQTGSPLNPCGDPPVGLGGVQTPPLSEGGSLRAQDIRTSGDPVGLDGTIIRVNPDTGAGLPGNPFFTSPDVNARRIVAYGLRMPFRFTPRPGANEIWAGDVGGGEREEINRISVGGPAANGGWPCYEGELVAPAWTAFNLCTSLVAQGPNAVLAPYFRYSHREPIFAGDPCPSGGSSVAGLAFYPGGSYPTRYDGALFFADFARHCIYAMMPGTNGLPDPTRIELLASELTGITDIRTGPGGDLYYTEIGAGRIWRLSYSGANRPPTAVITADRTDGPLPLTVRFDARSSVDPDGNPLHYEWDLDGDGAFDDSTSATPQRTYSTAGVIDVRLRAIDSLGLAGATVQRVTAGNTAPTVTITAPLTTTRWSVGDDIAFAASAGDPEDGTLPASAFEWRLSLQHCPGGCHEHPSGSWTDIRGGSFNATGHEFPSYLDLSVTVHDSGGLTTTKTVSIFPNVSVLSLETNPPGLRVDAEGSADTPFQRSVIRKNRISVSAPHQTLGFLPFEFDSWSDGGAQSHDVIMTTNRTLTARFSVRLLRVPDRVIVERDAPTSPGLPVFVNRISTRPITVDWTISPGSAGAEDVVLGSGTMTIPAGAGGRQIPATLLADALDEPTESFTVTLSSPTNAIASDFSAQVQVVDNDGPETFTSVASFDEATAATIATAADRLGIARNEMPSAGAAFLRFLASLDPDGVPHLSGPEPGEYQYETTYASRAERDAMLADAERYGLTGNQFHTVGAQFLAFLAFLG